VFAALSGAVSMARAAATARARAKIASATEAFLVGALGLDEPSPRKRSRRRPIKSRRGV
jgi:hypothetical protein